MTEDLRKKSKVLTDPGKWGPRAMLRATGLRDDDFEKPLIGIVNTWTSAMPCNIHLRDLSELAARGVREAGGVPLEVNAVAVSDGVLARGGASLVSREVIADSIELAAEAYAFDAVIAVGACDKTNSGSALGMMRLDVPSVFLYGGTTAAGLFQGRKISIQDMAEAVGAYSAGNITTEDMQEMERGVCPGAGACTGMYTSGTMATAMEVLGLTVPGIATVPAVSADRAELCVQTGHLALEALRRGATAREVITSASLRNAIVVTAALGGSTNLVLHLMAVARESGLELELEDFNTISQNTPRIGDFLPSGKHFLSDLTAAGGVQAVIRQLLDGGYLDGSALSMDGRTIAERIEAIQAPGPDQDVIFPNDDPIEPTSGWTILYGNVAPEGSVFKATGSHVETFTGPAKVFESETDAYERMQNGEVKEGDVVVIRGEGPVGGPGMSETARVTAGIVGLGFKDSVALITDGRFSGITHGIAIGHVSPESATGGPLALLRDGDAITIDTKARTIDADLSDEEWAERRAAWRPEPVTYSNSVFAKYARLVSSASNGAVTSNVPLRSEQAAPHDR